MDKELKEIIKEEFDKTSISCEFGKYGDWIDDNFSDVQDVIIIIAKRYANKQNKS